VQVITFGRNVLKVLEEARKSIQSFFDNRINFADEYADLKAKIEVIENNLDQRLPRFLKMRNFREVKNVLDQVRGSRGVFLKCLDIVQDQIRIWWEEYEQEISHLSIELEDRNLSKFDVRKLQVSHNPIFGSLLTFIVCACRIMFRLSIRQYVSRMTSLLLRRRPRILGRIF